MPLMGGSGSSGDPALDTLLALAEATKDPNFASRVKELKAREKAALDAEAKTTAWMAEGDALEKKIQAKGDAHDKREAAIAAREAEQAKAFSNINSRSIDLDSREAALAKATAALASQSAAAEKARSDAEAAASTRLAVAQSALDKRSSDLADREKLIAAREAAFASMRAAWDARSAQLNSILSAPLGGAA